MEDLNPAESRCCSQRTSRWPHSRDEEAYRYNINEIAFWLECLCSFSSLRIVEMSDGRHRVEAYDSEARVVGLETSHSQLSGQLPNGMIRAAKYLSGVGNEDETYSAWHSAGQYI